MAHNAGCQLETAVVASSLPTMRSSLPPSAHDVATGLNVSGMAIRLAHAAEARGDVTTPVTPVRPVGFSWAAVPRGTTTSQHWGTFWVPSGSVWIACPQPRPGASSPVSTWKTWSPVPSA